jgi:hypothetical protein
MSRDALEAEERDPLEPSDYLIPDQIFQRRWAQAILGRAQERLRENYDAKRKAPLYEALKSLPVGRENRGHLCRSLALGDD